MLDATKWCNLRSDGLLIDAHHSVIQLLCCLEGSRKVLHAAQDDIFMVKAITPQLFCFLKDLLTLIGAEKKDPGAFRLREFGFSL